MISRIFINHKTFKEACKYVCQDLLRAEVLDTEGVRYGHELMAEDFNLQLVRMPEKESPVFHGVLSFPHGEDPGDAKMVEIARRYLREIEVENTQFAIVKHTDKEHLHLHILANKVDNNGEPTGKGLIIERGIKAARKLTQEYQLRPEQGKNLELTNFEALNEHEAKRYRLYVKIKDHLPHCRQMEDLEKRLLSEGISTRYRTDPASGIEQGISFRIEGAAFAGSKVDPSYSLKNLQKTLALQEKQQLQQEQEAKQQRIKLDLWQEEKLRQKREQEQAQQIRPAGIDQAGSEQEAKQRKEDELWQEITRQPRIRQRDRTNDLGDDQRNDLRHDHGLSL